MRIMQYKLNDNRIVNTLKEALNSGLKYKVIMTEAKELKPFQIEKKENENN